MLLWLVIAYLGISIAIGLYGATKVHNARDYITAGRNLPMAFVLAMVFATWFGAETVLGISATFLEEISMAKHQVTEAELRYVFHQMEQLLQ